MTNGKGWKEENGTIFWRQEDTIDCHTNNNSFFAGLFDGHGGKEISNFLKNNFYNFFKESTKATTTEKLIDAFSKADEKSPEGEVGNIMYGYQGSTAIVGILEEKNNIYTLTVGWVGDSRLVLEHNGNVVFETSDHTPKNPHELDRIKKAGGEDKITNSEGGMRVNGIEVSRAIGDKELRDNLIIPIPEIHEINLNEEHNFLILASDGIWNNISSESAVKIVSQTMKMPAEQLKTKYPDNPVVQYGQLKGLSDEPIKENGDDHLKLVARALAYEAITAGSTDNISVIIVYLDKKLMQNNMNIDINTSSQNPKTQVNDKPVLQKIDTVSILRQIRTWWITQPTAKKYIYGLSATALATIAGLLCYRLFRHR
ncbi:MAG TPA: PP2C family protein-serine/threonine phosphatase [Candidatus Babeliales bacterium]|nr:PP2C family protein-serine/threonine phosphatase [Candidatus Babeliales bacterium]